MDTVVVVFKNGNIVSFDAQEFDADLTNDRSYVNKYAYKDSRGNDGHVHLLPGEVVGVFHTKSDAISYTVARRQ